MLLIPNALCWSSPKCNCAARACALLFFFTRRSWQKLFAGKNLVTAQTQLHLYSEQQGVFGISNICYCVIFAFYRQDLFIKNILSFHWHHLNDYTPHENKCFSSRNQNHCVTFVMCVDVRTDALPNMRCTDALNMQLARVSVEHTIHLLTSDGWAEHWPEAMKFLVNMPTD